MVETGPNWEMRLGDCIEGMRALADDSVDVVITDPPYDERTHKKGRRGHIGAAEFENRGQPSKRATYNRVRDLGFDPITHDEMRRSAKQFARLAKRWTLIFCAVEMIGDSAADGGSGWRAAGESAGLEYVRSCMWHKLGSTPQFTGDRPAQAVEAIVCFHRPGKKRWNGGGKHGYYAHPIVLDRGSGENRIHTTQKPLALMRDLVRDFSDPGELVLDAFAGSATTGVACLRADRRFLGWERSKCAFCSSTAHWSCHWTVAETPHGAHLCSSCREECAGNTAFTATRENYFDIACRRLRGDEAKPNPAQPSLFGGAA